MSESNNKKYFDRNERKCMTEEISKVFFLSGLKQEDLDKLKKWKEEESGKIGSNLELILATQNSELLGLNKKLRQQLEIVEKEFNLLKKEREEKTARKEGRANRKRLPKRQPVTPETYRLLIQAAESPSYISVRLRITFCLLIVTGIRINELLPLKVGQLQTLLESCWIGIDRSKRGPANHKAFLTNEGRKLVENKIIYNEVGVVLKSGKKKDQLIKNLTTSDITRRIEHIKFHEKIKNLEG